MTEMLYSPFGRTGHRSSRLIFGAAALGTMSQDRADKTLDLIRAAGVNHIDTAASYGESELRLAPFLADHRSEVFLATKTGDRSGTSARASLERSLTRMGVDQVDLIQLHNLVEEDEWQLAFSPGGAVEALAGARDDGLCRFIGVTGHGVRIPGMHLRSLAEFPFESVLFPFNFSMMQLDDYRRDVDELRALCAERSVAGQTIKSIARRRWPDGGKADGPRFSWYEPLNEPSAIARAVRYVLSEPDLFLNTTSDARLLPAIIQAASDVGARPGPVPPADLETDTDHYAITPLFDGSQLEVI